MQTTHDPAAFLPVRLHTILGLIAFDADHTHCGDIFAGPVAHNLRMDCAGLGTETEKQNHRSGLNPEVTSIFRVSILDLETSPSTRRGFARSGDLLRLEEKRLSPPFIVASGEQAQGGSATPVSNLADPH